MFHTQLVSICLSIRVWLLVSLVWWVGLTWGRSLGPLFLSLPSLTSLFLKLICPNSGPFLTVQAHPKQKIASYNLGPAYLCSSVQQVWPYTFTFESVVQSYRFLSCLSCPSCLSSNSSSYLTHCLSICWECSHSWQPRPPRPLLACTCPGKSFDSRILSFLSSSLFLSLG